MTIDVDEGLIDIDEGLNMEKETIGLKAIIMFDMLHVLLNMMEICTKLHFWPISSHIFDRRVLRHVRSRFVMFDYTPATKYNRVDMYCVVPIGTGATYRKNCFFPIFFPKEIPEFRRSKFWEKSCRNLTDIGTEIWKIFSSNPALLGWLRCWLEIGIIYREMPCPKAIIFLGSVGQTGFWAWFALSVDNVQKYFAQCECGMQELRGYAFATQFGTNTFYIEQPKFAQQWNPYLIHNENPDGFIN